MAKTYTEAINIKLTPEMKAAVEKLAVAQGTTVTAYVRDMLAAEIAWRPRLSA